jgi:eukaryotic-like serine/threonine-protein kinase
MITVNGYTNLEPVGQGGVGDVYRAVNELTGTTVAIKVLRDVSDQSVAWHRTRREFAALKALTGHPNVIQLIELIELEQGPALVMELAPGGSVADMMRCRESAMSTAETVQIGRDTATALVAAHQQGIVHRDIKPQNLLFDAMGKVKLCDFGIAALAHSEKFRARTNALSHRYASPEDLDNEGEVGPACDVYSLGATLLHIARGAPPTLRERLKPWRPPAGTSVEVAALDAVIAACLRPNPKHRPTAAQVLTDLDLISVEPGPVEAVWSDDLTLRSVPPIEQPDFPDAVEQPGARRSPEQPNPAVVRPAPARPAIRSRHRIAARCIVAASLLGIAVVVFVALSQGPRSGDVSSMQKVKLTTRPTNLPELTDVAWPFGGDGVCLVQSSGADELMPVTCDHVHDVQRFATATLDQTLFPANAVFDSEMIEEAVGAICTPLFETFVGGPYRSSQLQISITRPSPGTWRTGDRVVQCLLGVGGRRVIGDARNSAS